MLGHWCALQPEDCAPMPVGPSRHLVAPPRCAAACGGTLRDSACRTESDCILAAHASHSAQARAGAASCLSRLMMDATIKIALVGAGMFGGDVHARVYADLQQGGISPQLGRVGLDRWARDLAPIKFQLVAVAARTPKSARRARRSFKRWTGQAPQAFAGPRPWLDILRAFPDLDVMAVATPDPLHAEVILSALKAGVPCPHREADVPGPRRGRPDH